ncbi:hypothetical protein PIB30_111299, partial [Stylosanthes scabra]|nr:hypothetical protein [Stylosanthes scabra]
IPQLRRALVVSSDEFNGGFVNSAMNDGEGNSAVTELNGDGTFILVVFSPSTFLSGCYLYLAVLPSLFEATCNSELQ